MSTLNRILILLCVIPFWAMAQDDVYTIAKVMPEFPGGVNQLRDFISSNMKYPTEALENKYSGRSYVNFIVDTTGKVLTPKIIKSSGHKCLDDEALRIVKLMPKWTPGSDSIKKVKVAMNLPIGFKNLGTLSEAPGKPVLTAEEKERHENAMAQWNEGHKFEQKFMFEKALEKFDKSLSIEANNKYALFDKGKMLMVLGKKDKACEVWNKMIQDNIRKEEAEEFTKKYCADEHGVEEMKKYYSAIKANSFFDQGMSEVRNGRYEAALKRFDSCLKYNPEHLNGLFNKAQMHFNLEQKKAACTTWKTLMAIKPDDKETEDLLKKHCN